ncbi:hypothetical protein INQ40_05355 [Lysobacter sp. H21R4]|uniref:hypothetical protein n=1 Tax=Lysobacter sp. H21R4 TaxID=2781021 RepID=UPI001886E24E|nr:hypothetical protein [Lysobacter sp. H21R4]QOY63651.1 hypothetical protein INQ40_05355 [Lysobacter sp. H21R4]
MKGFPTWIVISLTAILLFGGLEIADLFASDADELRINELSEAPPELFLGVGIPTMILEALFWTVSFVELGAKYARSALLGAALGVLGYGVVFHWSGGLVSILASSWIALVLNGSYVLLLQRSRTVAILSTVSLKVAFLLSVAFTIYG